MTKIYAQKLEGYWTTLSEHDWDAMKRLFRGRSFAQALFYLHLSLEKILKAKIVHDTKDHAPYSHDLTYLMGKTEIDCPEQILEVLRTISTFNMEARYPDQDLKFYKKATKDFTQEWIAKGTKIRSWLLLQFKNK